MDQTTEEKKYTPLLPYDGLYGENFTTYQTMAYHCDRDACHPFVGVDTGNMVKYYRCNLLEDPFIVEQPYSGK